MAGMNEQVMVLRGGSALGDWMDDPEGLVLITGMLASVGSTPDQLSAARGLSLRTLAAIDQTGITHEMVDALVRAANSGELLPDVDEAALARRRAPAAVRTGLSLADIQIRDPFILWSEAEGQYYLFGSTDPNIWDGPGIGFDTYRSADLAAWTGPFPAFRPPSGFWAEGQFWAPEVHFFRGQWYMFATFTSPDGFRGTQILRADEPVGPFLPWSEGAVTPREWQCLDGTLFVDDWGLPWIVFCHEWMQIGDGEVCAQRMAEDLKSVLGEPIRLFGASEAPWSTPLEGVRTGPPAYVTDGPSLFRLGNGDLLMLWSSHGANGYAMGIARSETGSINGPWTQESQALFPADGGHGMVLRLPSGQLVLTLHQPNTTPDERAVILSLVESERTLRLASGRGLA